MLTIYKWEVFECPQASKRPKKRMDYYFSPVELHSTGRMKLMRQGTAGIVAYGVFQMLVMYSATLPVERRGELSRSSGEPMTLEDLAQILMVELAVFTSSLELLVNCGWIIQGDAGQITKLTSNERELTESFDNPIKSAKKSANPQKQLPRGEERKGEEKKIEEKKGERKKKGQTFVRPGVDLINIYSVEAGLGIDAQAFFDFYQSKGWMVGKNKMKDWKAAARNWSRSSRKPKAGPTTFQSAKEQATADAVMGWKPEGLK